MEKRKTLIFLLGIIIFSFFSWSYMTKPGFFSMHDDMQFMRLYQMDKCFKDRQIPCRWVPDLGYGYGYPLFNYYPSLPYYTGEIIHLVFGASFVDTVKILFALGFILSGVTMFFLAREFWGEVGGFLSAIFYIYAPYHAVDVYVRGAMSEHWALIWFPLILLAIYKVIKEDNFAWVVLLACSIGLLFLSHNIMSMLFSIISVCWTLMWLLLTKNISKIFRLAIGVFWGIGIASFFLLPALVEKKFAHTETMLMGYFNYLAHFVTLKQLFLSTEWGWGASVYGPEEKMPFMIGFLHWIVSLVTFFLAILFWRKKEKGTLFIVFSFALFFFFVTAFMTHERSTPIWLQIKVLEFLQFPWRFLGLVIFFASFMVGALTLFLKNLKIRMLVSLILIGFLIFTVKDYFRPEVHYDIKDQDRLSGKAWQLALTNAIFDYLPIYAKYPPAEEAPKEPQIIEGQAKITDFKKGTNWQTLKIDVNGKEAKIRFSIYDFPGWKVYLDNKQIEIDHDNFLGLITIQVPKGPHQIVVRLTNTKIRTMGNLMTLTSILPLIYLGGRQLRKKWSRG